MNDPDLLNLYDREGDREAFNELVKRHIHWLHSAAIRRVQDPAMAQDIVQAVFLTLLKKKPKLPAGGSLAPWLFKTLGFIALNAIRAESRRKHHESEAAGMRQTEQSDRDWSELAPLLDPAVESLPKPDREVILLRFYQQLPFPQIARMLDATEEAARKRLTRAVERLRKRLLKTPEAKNAMPAAALTALLLRQTVEAAPADLASTAFNLTASAATEKVYSLSQGAMRHMFFAKIKLIGAACAAILITIAVSIAVARAGEPLTRPTTQATLPDMDANPLYSAWVNAKNASVSYTRTELISGGAPIPGNRPAPSVSRFTVALEKLTDEKAVLKITRDGESEILDVLANLPDPNKLRPAGEEAVQIGDQSYDCRKYAYKSNNPAEVGRNTQGMSASVMVWINPDVPGGVVKREIQLTIRASYNITELLDPR